MKSDQEIVLDSKLNLIKMVEEKWQIPMPDPEWQVKVAALAEAKLVKHRSIAVHQMRIEQAKALFPHFPTYSKCIEFLMGESHNKIIKGKVEQDCGLIYNHHRHTLVSEWSSTPSQYVRTAKSKIPFIKSKKWSVDRYNLDQLSNPIPLDTIVAINYLKNLHFFNIFNGLQSSNGKVLIIAIFMGNARKWN